MLVFLSRPPIDRQKDDVLREQLTGAGKDRMLELGTDQARPESQLESESCRTRLLELQGEFRK